MAYINWSPAYDTGIPEIDYEHHRLVDLLNRIHELIAERAERREIADSLADFHTLAAAHFALEEKIMRDQKYRGFEERRAMHYRLLEQVREIMDSYETGSCRTGKGLPATLREWLSEAMDIDTKLFAEINEANLRRWGLNRR